MAKILWSALGIFVVIGIIFAIIGFFGGWGQKALDTVSAQHVSEQYGEVIRNWNGLTTAADNACSAAQAETDSDSPTFVEAPGQAYIATYRNLRTEYNSAWQNIFDAKLVGPAGYPHEVPNYPEATGVTPDFCSVSTKLAALQMVN